MLHDREPVAFHGSLADHDRRTRCATTCRMGTIFVNRLVVAIVPDPMKALPHRRPTRIRAWINLMLHRQPLRQKLKQKIIILIYTVNLISILSIVCTEQFLIISAGFGALAALKRKRKKFSRSRNTSPILEPPHNQEADSSSAVNQC